MSKRKARAIVLVAVMLLALVIFLVWTTSSANADGGPSEDPVATDPCFRQDPEGYLPGGPCYDPNEQKEVECDNNVFVPLNSDGTWTCPGDQLPEEVIGSARGDCPDAQVSYVTDVEGHYICLPPANQVERGGSHPFVNWSLILQILADLFG